MFSGGEVSIRSFVLRRHPLETDLAVAQVSERIVFTHCNVGDQIRGEFFGVPVIVRHRGCQVGKPFEGSHGVHEFMEQDIFGVHAHPGVLRFRSKIEGE